MSLPRPCQHRLLLLASWSLGLGAVLVAPRLVTLTDAGDFLIRNSVRVALVYWAVAAGLMARALSATARVAWTLSCAAYLVHVALAFEHAHGWSHAQAFRHVETASGYGEGIFVSYLFTLVWSLDVAWWWLARASYLGRPRWVGWVVHGFMAFVIVNATVVFEAGPTRWVGLFILAILGAWLLLRSQGPG